MNYANAGEETYWRYQRKVKEGVKENQKREVEERENEIIIKTKFSEIVLSIKTLILNIIIYKIKKDLFL